jgi:hypothetical protein
LSNAVKLFGWFYLTGRFAPKTQVLSRFRYPSSLAKAFGGRRRLIGHPITCATSNSEPAAAFTLPTDARGVRSSGARVQKKLDGKPGFVPMTLRQGESGLSITNVRAVTSRSLHIRQREKRKALLPTLATTDWRLPMFDDSKVTQAPRILARQLARPLTDDEIDHIAGGMMAREIGGTSGAPRADTCSTTGCPANDSDC